MAASAISSKTVAKPITTGKNASDEQQSRTVFSTLHVHAIFVLAHGHPRPHPDHVQTIHATFSEICLGFHAELLQAQGFGDQLHLLIGYPPTLAIAELLKTLQDTIPAWQWNPTFFVASCRRPDLIQQMKRYLKATRSDTRNLQ